MILGRAKPQMSGSWAVAEGGPLARLEDRGWAMRFFWRFGWTFMTTATWAILAVTLAGAIGIVIGRLSAADSTTPQPAAHALVMQNELREGLDLDQLVLHYQPKVELGSSRVVCLEALVRWQHPGRGLP